MKGVRGGPEGQRWGVRLGGGTQRRPRDSGRGGGGGRDAQRHLEGKDSRAECRSSPRSTPDLPPPAGTSELAS